VQAAQQLGELLGAPRGREVHQHGRGDDAQRIVRGKLDVESGRIGFRLARVPGERRAVRSRQSGEQAPALGPGDPPAVGHDARDSLQGANVLEGVLLREDEIGPLSDRDRAELFLAAEQAGGVQGRRAKSGVGREPEVLEALHLLDEAEARHAQPRGVGARENGDAALVERFDELALELVADRETGQPLGRPAIGVRVVGGLERRAHGRRQVDEVRILEVGLHGRRLADDVVKGDERRDDGDSSLAAHRDGLRDLRRVERVNDLVSRVGVVVEERVDVLLRVRDGLPGGERRLEARLARHVPDENEILLLRFGGEGRVLRRADLVVDLDGVVAGCALAIDLRDGLFGRTSAVEGRAGRVDRRAEEPTVGDAPAPGEVRGPAVQVEDRGHPVDDVERQFLRRVEVDVHVGQPRHHVTPRRVDDLGSLRNGCRGRVAERHDPSARDDDGLITQQPRLVHRHHGGVDEGDRARRRRGRGKSAVGREDEPREYRQYPTRADLAHPVLLRHSFLRKRRPAGSRRQVRNFVAFTPTVYGRRFRRRRERREGRCRP
jgi:hypothetical protein